MKHLTILACALLLCACGEKPSPAGNSALIGDELGTIRFAASGNEEARRHLERGVKLLHHMTYSEADKAFAAAIEADPQCVMAYWGRAMSIIHPVWPDEPNEAQLKAGWQHVHEAKERGTGIPREEAYLDPIEAYFRDGWNRTEKDRLTAMDRAWERVHREHPDDVEAACFYALFHLGPLRFLPKDASHRAQLEAGAIVERVLQEIPDHPGAQHYQIHAYDSPLLAGRALEVCGNYGSIAPHVPHALHMPTHIYTRRGQWAESIELNLRAADAAWELGEDAGGLSFEYLHTLDYAVYAYLQLAQYRKAEDLRDQVLALDGPYLPENLAAAAFAFAAIPARVAIEQQHWDEAARLEPRRPVSFPWDERFIAYESIVHFARGIGALRSGDLNAAARDIQAHGRLADGIRQKFPRTYWDAQATTQQLAMQAWLALGEERHQEAVALMREAADIEAATEKEAVTPGEIIPAGELLGDMLLELARYGEAMAAYESVLSRSPNRFHSVYGVGRAAELGGDVEKAARYYEQILALTVGAAADPSPRLQHAKAFLAVR